MSRSRPAGRYRRAAPGCRASGVSASHCGEGETIRTALADCRFGRLLVGATDRGVCFIGFAEPDAALLGDLRRRFPQARIVADDAGLAATVRAVARSCATNPVSLAVPCHRVVGSNGDLTGYHWGLPRKAALLAREVPAINLPRQTPGNRQTHQQTNRPKARSQRARSSLAHFCSGTLTGKFLLDPLDQFDDSAAAKDNPVEMLIEAGELGAQRFKLLAFRGQVRA
jgi:O-6-methylguanine DNA methyltransferase